MNDFHEKFGFLFEIVTDRVTDAETGDEDSMSRLTDTSFITNRMRNSEFVY